MIRALVVLALVANTAHADVQRTIAGSLQLDYLAVPTESHPAAFTFDATTVELSLKMSVDFSKNASATVKACFACHGFEAAAAFVDLRAADELRVRVGRMTPSFGSFPERYDPANHRTSDKPLPYDMGRMLHKNDWNEGVLPAPWVDNGIEVGGTHFFEAGRVDYAVYALSGPKADANASDFDFVRSHTPAQYYVDNNSEPIVGARLAGTLEAEDFTLTTGASAMGGHYDPDRKLAFSIIGVDVVAKIEGVSVRGEYLLRHTQMDLGAMPAMNFKPGPDGTFDDTFSKHGYYVETEVPVGPVDLIARFDGLRRIGNVPLSSPLAYHASITRYTLAAAYRATANVRIKTSVEYYQFSDFQNELALHLGVATPF
jgi:hypothetical protein